MPCGSQSKNHARQQRRADGEPQRLAVERHLRKPGNVGGTRGDEHFHTPVTDESAHPAAEQRQHDAFRQQLAHHPPAPGTERQSQRDFLLSRGSAGQHQVGHIRARDQQHAGHDAPQHQQCRARIPSHRLLQQRHDGDSRGHCSARMLLCEPRLDCVQLGLRLRQRHARFESRQHAQPIPAAPVSRQTIPTGGQPKLSVLWKLEARRHHAHDGAGAPAIGIDRE